MTNHNWNYHSTVNTKVYKPRKPYICMSLVRDLIWEEFLAAVSDSEVIEEMEKHYEDDITLAEMREILFNEYYEDRMAKWQ